MTDKTPKNSPETAPEELVDVDDIQDASAEEDPLNKALLEAAQWKDAAHRAAAELDNYRKRMAREMQDSLRYANAGLLESLLPVLDNFDYGMQAAKAESEGSNLYLGLSMVLRQIQDFLKENHVEEIVAVGAPFDPNVHEAVSQQPSGTVAEGTVLQQTRKGYKLRDRLLRPASVIVSSGPAAESA
ncbi:MAG: nucleotide exchange factor GrpE [Verrucomicrobiaceae bacterium]|nr:MAG: nucleotide exchange factor GrpE [Verrucomicrobiaceae bacterium]